MSVSIFDIEDRGWLGNLPQLQQRLFSKMQEFSPKELRDIFESYVTALARLNNSKLAEYAKNSGLCSDGMEFYNLRAAIIIGGEYLYDQIVRENYRFLPSLNYCVDVACGVENNIRSSILYAYMEKTEGSLIIDSSFFSDELFVQTILCETFQFGGEGPSRQDYSIIMGGDILREVNIMGLGTVRQGDLLVHKTLGVCWLYVIARDPLDNIKAFAVAKDSFHNLVINHPNIWRKYRADTV